MNKIPEKTLQTAENTWYLFPSTDTTAIYSFILAAFVGIVLALIGVFLAWWFGKKSFNLTTMSFKTNVELIQASVVTARDNTERNFQMNLDLIQSQKEIQHKELNFKYMIDWIVNFDNLSSEYLGEVISYAKLINSYVLRDELALSDIDKKWDNYLMTLEEIDKKLQGISTLKFRLTLIINAKTELEISIIEDLNFMDEYLRSDYFTESFAYKKEINWLDPNYLQLKNKIENCKENMLKLRFCKTFEQLQSL